MLYSVEIAHTRRSGVSYIFSTGEYENWCRIKVGISNLDDHSATGEDKILVNTFIGQISQSMGINILSIAQQPVQLRVCRLHASKKMKYTHRHL